MLNSTPQELEFLRIMHNQWLRELKKLQQKVLDERAFDNTNNLAYGQYLREFSFVLEQAEHQLNYQNDRLQGKYEPDEESWR